MNEISETGMDMTAAAWRLERSQGYAALAEKYGGFESHMDQGRRTAFYSGFGLARKIFAKPSDAALIEEAARRGMSVMDAAEAARLRGTAEGVEKLADEWDVDSGNAEAKAAEAGPRSLTQRPVQDAIARLSYVHSTALRALLHGDIESEAGA